MSAPTTISVDVPAVPAFDYNTVSGASADDLRRSATSIRAHITKTTVDIIETGREFADAKQRLDHGKFEAWVQSEVGVTVRTAQMYMAAARLADVKGETISLLPHTTVRMLTQKSAPPSVVDQVVAQTKAGKVVPDVVIVEMIEDARNQRRQIDYNKRKVANKAKSRSAKDQQERSRVEALALRARQEEHEAAVRILDALGRDRVRLLLAELGQSMSLFNIIEELRKLLPAQEKAQ